jgi:hypothetical protein
MSSIIHVQWRQRLVRAICLIILKTLHCLPSRSIDVPTSNYKPHTTEPPTIFPPYVVTGNRLFAARRLPIYGSRLVTTLVLLMSTQHDENVRSWKKSIRWKGPRSYKIVRTHNLTVIYTKLWVALINKKRNKYAPTSSWKTTIYTHTRSNYRTTRVSGPAEVLTTALGNTLK